jgi:hypothetical protein
MRPGSPAPTYEASRRLACSHACERGLVDATVVGDRCRKNAGAMGRIRATATNVRRAGAEEQRQPSLEDCNV